MTAKAPYKRKHPGVAPRLRQFFIDNPDEELSISDIMTKFECSNASARQAIKEVRDSFPILCMCIYRRKEVA